MALLQSTDIIRLNYSICYQNFPYLIELHEIREREREDHLSKNLVCFLIYLLLLKSRPSAVRSNWVKLWFWVEYPFNLSFTPDVTCVWLLAHRVPLYRYFYYLTGTFSHLSTSVVEVFLHASQGSCQGASWVKMLVGRWRANAASVPGRQSPWKRSAQACRLVAAETLERSKRRGSGHSHRLVWGEYLKRMYR